MKYIMTLTLTLGLMALMAPGLRAKWFVDLESGAVFSGYNDVRVPNSTGTEISLTDDLDPDGQMYFRARVGLNWQNRHTMFLLIAPLTLQADGIINRPVLFEGAEFPARTGLEARYTFNSYRLTYRYLVYRQPRWAVALGFTAKIRDAAIKLDDPSQKSETTNVGFVPLISFKFTARLATNLHATLEGDALAAPQGRAEDVALMVEYSLSKPVAVKAGYRILEGGADVETVYNFAMFHYFFFGTSWEF